VDQGIGFEQYRDERIEALPLQQARLKQQLTGANLSAAEARRLERQKTYYARLAAMPVPERDRRLRQRFDEIDANHDGKLDKDEVAWSINHSNGH
jgi:hypothetical protein